MGEQRGPDGSRKDPLSEAIFEIPRVVYHDPSVDPTAGLPHYFRRAQLFSDLGIEGLSASLVFNEQKYEVVVQHLYGDTIREINNQRRRLMKEPRENGYYFPFFPELKRIDDQPVSFLHDVLIGYRRRQD